MASQCAEAYIAAEKESKEKKDKDRVPPRFFLPSLRKQQNLLQTFYASWGTLHVNGVVDAATAYSKPSSSSSAALVLPVSLPLPTYPFQRERYWLLELAPSVVQVASGKVLQTSFTSPSLRRIIYLSCHELIAACYHTGCGRFGGSRAGESCRQPQGSGERSAQIQLYVLLVRLQRRNRQGRLNPSPTTTIEVQISLVHATLPVSGGR